MKSVSGTLKVILAKILENQPIVDRISLINWKHYTVIGTVILVSFFFLYLTRINYNAVHKMQFEDDEYHTVIQSIDYIKTGKITTFRVPEGARRFAELAYPYALMSLCQHMGGEHYTTGWDYPGHNYILARYQKFNDPNTLKDPNVVDFLSAMRKFYVALVYISFLPIFYFFLKRKCYFVLAFCSVLLGTSTIMLHEQSLFYVEPAMIVATNLIFGLFLNSLRIKEVGWRTFLVMGFLTGLMIATKISTVFFAMLAVVVFWRTCQHAKHRAFELAIIFLFSMGISFVLISWPAFENRQIFNQFLHEFISNFYHYATGHRTPLEPGWPVFSLIIGSIKDLMGYFVYLLPVLVGWGVIRGSIEERFILCLLALIVSLSFYSLSNQAIFLSRNSVPFYPSLAFIVSISLDILGRDVCGRYQSHHRWRRGIISFMVVLLLAFAPRVQKAGGIASFVADIWPSVRQSTQLSLKSTAEANPSKVIHVVDVPENFYKNVIPDQGRVKKEASTPLADFQFPQYEKESNKIFLNNSIVVVRRIKNNKHLTNYILPKIFQNNFQYGDYFIFY